ncbi:hypothetical protein [Romboutsia sp.]|uniref:hypothetical protein n=1 Tax=Romboutsia sp. TaxID=1965302 RepID=UPI002C85E4B5|nr:hypothetical protein [Romboutsia sp.]HSQ88768.1 hypothetical protein [Romboutsia sp.]
MNLVGIENITPYEGVVEFKVYRYDDEIDLGNKDLFVCDLKVVMVKVNPIYVEKIGKSIDVLALVTNLNSNAKKVSIQNEIKEFILDEILEENLQKENIDVMFIES